MIEHMNWELLKDVHRINALVFGFSKDLHFLENLNLHKFSHSQVSKNGFCSLLELLCSGVLIVEVLKEPLLSASRLVYVRTTIILWLYEAAFHHSYSTIYKLSITKRSSIWFHCSKATLQEAFQKEIGSPLSIFHLIFELNQSRPIVMDLQRLLLQQITYLLEIFTPSNKSSLKDKNQLGTILLWSVNVRSTKKYILKKEFIIR